MRLYRKLCVRDNHIDLGGKVNKNKCLRKIKEVIVKIENPENNKLKLLEPTLPPIIYQLPK